MTTEPRRLEHAEEVKHTPTKFRVFGGRQRQGGETMWRKTRMKDKFLLSKIHF